MLDITCWKDIIAVCLISGDIVILDGITGTQAAIISGHTSCVRSLAFLQDGTSVVSGSYDNTIKLWDVQTGGIVKTFHGHTKEVYSVSISADCTIIASGSEDRTIRLWNIQTGECHCVIKHQTHVDSVVFSPSDLQHLVSVSGGKVWHLGLDGHKTRAANNGSHIAFSFDGTQFALCQRDNIVVKNTNSRANVAKFHMPDGKKANRCCFSPDGRLIAIAAGPIAYVWDTTSSYPHPIKTLIGHTYGITSLAFSSPSSLVTTSLDKLTKFWQIGALQIDPVVTNLESAPLTSAEIRSVTVQADDGIAISSDSEGVVRTWDISTGLCVASFETPAKGSEGSDVRLVSSGLFLTWHTSGYIYMWDVEKEEYLCKVRVRTEFLDTVMGVRISGDGSKVFCMRKRDVQALSVLTGEVVGKVGVRYGTPQRFLSINGSCIWVHSSDSEPVGWDFGIPGSPPVQLSNSLSLHSNKTGLWDTGQSRIIDTATGKVVFKLAGKVAEPTDSQWDGQYLVLGYKSGEVLILNFNHMFP